MGFYRLTYSLTSFGVHCHSPTFLPPIISYNILPEYYLPYHVRPTQPVPWLQDLLFAKSFHLPPVRMQIWGCQIFRITLASWTFCTTAYTSFKMEEEESRENHPHCTEGCRQITLLVSKTALSRWQIRIQREIYIMIVCIWNWYFGSKTLQVERWRTTMKYSINLVSSKNDQTNLIIPLPVRSAKSSRFGLR